MTPVRAKEKDDDYRGQTKEQEARDVHALLQSPHESPELHVPTLAFLLRADTEKTYDARHDAGGREPEGEAHVGVGVGAGAEKGGRGDTESGRSDDRPDVALEKVRTHTRDVAHVVADVVGDHRGVVWVVLVDARLDLTHEVRTDVRSLRVNAPGHAGKEGDRGGAEAEA